MQLSPCLELSMLFGKTFYGLVSPIGQKWIRPIFLYRSSNFHSYLQTLQHSSSNASTMEMLIFHNTFGLLYPALSAVGGILQFPFLSFLVDSQASLWHGLAPQFVSSESQLQSPCKYKHPTFQNQLCIFSKKKKKRNTQVSQTFNCSAKSVFLTNTHHKRGLWV